MVDPYLDKVRLLIGSVPYHNKTDKNWQGVHPVSLVTLDDKGFPSARTVVPREIASDLSTFRLQTRLDSVKIGEISANPKVALNWQDQRGKQGWLTIKGNAKMEPCRDMSDRTKVDIIVTATEIRTMTYNDGMMMRDTDEAGWQPVVLSRQKSDGIWKIM